MYDLIIKNIQEKSESKIFTYTAKALFINELAKNGLDLVYDPELENSIGTIEELAEKAIEGTDWRISSDSEKIRQTNIEPLYIATLQAPLVGYNIFNEEETIEIESGKEIFVFYSCIENKEAFFQFLYNIFPILSLTKKRFTCEKDLKILAFLLF